MIKNTTEKITKVITERTLKKPFKYLAGLLLACVVALGMVFSFNAKGDTATIIAGLWSAFSTTILGGIAFIQNRHYRKLADDTAKNSQTLQEDIRNLNNDMKDAISTLQKIEKAKYYPNFQNEHIHKFCVDRGFYLDLLGNPNYEIQYNFIHTPISYDFVEDPKNFLLEHFNEFKYFAFILKNIGEKTIRNFQCKHIEASFTKTHYYIHILSCDIKPGQSVCVMLINIPAYDTLYNENIRITFEMNNLIADTFSLLTELTFYTNGPEDGPSVHVEVELPKPE